MKYINWKELSKKRKGYLLTFFGIVGVLAWAFISAGLITHNFNRSQLSVGKDQQEAQVNGMIITETKDQHKYWEIYGETGSYDSTTGVAMLNNVIGNFYDSQNQVSMSFESTHGSYNPKKSQIVLYDNTRVVIKDGTTLLTDRLTWSGSDKPIIARGGIKIIRNKEFLATADLVEISPNYEHFKIIGHAVSKMYDSKNTAAGKSQSKKPNKAQLLN